MSILLSRPRLITCQIKPRIKCSLPSAKSLGPMLTTEQPIPLAEVMTMLLFSVIWKALSGLGFPFAPEGLFRTRSSMVSGTESFMSLQRTRPSRARKLYLTLAIHDGLPRHSSKSCIVSVGIGRRCPMSLSPARTWSNFSHVLPSGI